MLKSNHLFLLVFYILFHCSCLRRCDDKVCPGFDKTYESWFVYSAGDTIKFVNDSGITLDFVVDRIEETPSKIVKCNPARYCECECYNCGPTPTGKLYAFTTDSSRHYLTQWGDSIYYNKIEIVIYNNYVLFKDSFTLGYGLFGSYNNVYIEPSLRPRTVSGDTMFSTINFGGINYDNVIVDYPDTIVSIHPLIYGFI